jgi:hypothetical protein
MNRTNYLKQIEKERINKENEFFQQRLINSRSYYIFDKSKNHKSSIEKINKLSPKSKTQKNYFPREISNDAKNKTSYNKKIKIKNNTRDQESTEDIKNETHRSLKLPPKGRTKSDIKLNELSQLIEKKILYSRKAFMPKLLLVDVIFYLENKK